MKMSRVSLTTSIGFRQIIAPRGLDLPVQRRPQSNEGAVRQLKGPYTAAPFTSMETLVIDFNKPFRACQPGGPGMEGYSGSDKN